MKNITHVLSCYTPFPAKLIGLRLHSLSNAKSPDFASSNFTLKIGGCKCDSGLSRCSTIHRQLSL